MDSKNTRVWEQIRTILGDIKQSDPAQYQIIMDTLDLIYKEYNSGRDLRCEQKLYDAIDAEIKFKQKNGVTKWLLRNLRLRISYPIMAQMF